MKMYQTDGTDVVETNTAATPAPQPAAATVIAAEPVDQTTPTKAVEGEAVVDEDAVAEAEPAKSRLTQAIAVFAVAAIGLLVFQTVRATTTSTTTAEEAIAQLAIDPDALVGGPVTMDAALESAAQWRTTNGSFYGFTPPEGYLMAVGFGNIVFSTQQDGICVIGAMVNGNGPTVATDPTGAGCSVSAMTEAQTAIDTAESG